MPFTAYIGVIRLDALRENPALLPLQHYQYELVLHRPGRLLGHTDLSLQFQGRDAVLALDEQVHGQEPLLEREMGVVEDLPTVTLVCWRQVLLW